MLNTHTLINRLSNVVAPNERCMACTIINNEQINKSNSDKLNMIQTNITHISPLLYKIDDTSIITCSSYWCFRLHVGKHVNKVIFLKHVVYKYSSDC